MKKLRYTIKAIIELDAACPSALEDLLDRIREDGEAEIVNVEVIEEDSKN